MKARIIYEVECPPVNCDREDFLKWLELNLYVPGACVTSDNPLLENHWILTPQILTILR